MIIDNQQLEELAIEYFLQTSVGDKLGQALNVLKKLQNNVVALCDKEESISMTALKGATVLTFALLEKLSEGKSIKDINSIEWREISNKVSTTAVLQDEQCYTIYVFSKYEEYIRSYASQLKEYRATQKADAIIKIADEIADKTNLLKRAEITEVTYIEECMWLSLEGMMKLIASVTSLQANITLEDFSWAVSSFAFEYGRYILYNKEMEIVNQFIDSQHIMDNELHKKYESFIMELSEQTNLFCAMIDKAFVPNFKETFINSVVLAKAMGIEDEEILKNEEEIDSFFLD